MAGSVAGADFNTWLSEKLISLNGDTDLDIFVSYITGILETETVKEDQINSLSELLSELMIDSKSDTDKMCEEIIAKWSNINDISSDDVITSKNHVDLDTRMHEIIVQQTTESAKLKATQKIHKDDCKDVIIAQYSHVSDGEETDEDSDDKKLNTSKTPQNKQNTSSAATGQSQGDLLTKNVNSALVKEREKQARDHAKQESEVKKQKDKEDREKQKQKSADRKENEKKRTQKVEKKR